MSGRPVPESRYVISRSWAPDPRDLPGAAVAADDRPRRSFWRVAAVAALSALIGAGTAIGAVALLDEDEPVAVVETPFTVDGIEPVLLTPDDGGSRAAAVARKVLPSIVTVEVRGSDVGTFIAEGSGSGVVLSADGQLVTNQHVVDAAEQVRVVFPDGRMYEATIVGVDALTDLAVLQIEATGLVPVEIGATQTMQIGDDAIAVGSPLGLEGGPSVTVGVVSAFDRRVQTGLDEELFGMLQTDAPITRGSSGGALVDNEGQLIGITTAIGVSDVGAEGLGFAIPIELVTRITSDLIEFGEARHAFLGVTGSTFFEEDDDGATIPAGVAVASVFEDTAAALAGIEAGDVIRSMNGEPVTTMEQLVVDVRFYRVDQTVDVVVDRGGERLTLALTLLERPEGL
jgi:putative serine protease PepD